MDEGFLLQKIHLQMQPGSVNNVSNVWERLNLRILIRHFDKFPIHIFQHLTSFKMRIHRFTTCLLMIAAWGCQTDSETILPADASAKSQQEATEPATNLRIRQMLVTGDNGGLGPLFTNTYFTYAKGRELDKVTIPTDTYAGQGTSIYTYDKQGRVTVIRSLREYPTDNGVKGYQTNYKYTDSTIVKTSSLVDTEGNLLVNSLSPNAKVTYRLNNEGLVYEEFEEGKIIWGSETTELRRHTYENGNIVKTTALDPQGQIVVTYYYEYDDKINPFYKWSYMLSPSLTCSRNNAVSWRTSKSAPQRTEYTYNEQGLPLTEKNLTKGAVLTYDYETFEK